MASLGDVRIYDRILRMGLRTPAVAIHKIYMVFTLTVWARSSSSINLARAHSSVFSKTIEDLIRNEIAEESLHKLIGRQGVSLCDLARAHALSSPSKRQFHRRISGFKLARYITGDRAASASGGRSSPIPTRAHDRPPEPGGRVRHEMPDHLPSLSRPWRFFLR